MQTLFILNVPFIELCRFWDSYFCFGLDFFIAISLSIIHYFENDLFEFNDSTNIIRPFVTLFFVYTSQNAVFPIIETVKERKKKK